MDVLPLWFRSRIGNATFLFFRGRSQLPPVTCQIGSKGIIIITEIDCPGFVVRTWESISSFEFFEFFKTNVLALAWRT